MAVVQCGSCGKKMIEDKDIAILTCKYCGSGPIKVIKDD